MYVNFSKKKRWQRDICHKSINYGLRKTGPRHILIVYYEWFFWQVYMLWLLQKSNKLSSLAPFDNLVMINGYKWGQLQLSVEYSWLLTWIGNNSILDQKKLHCNKYHQFRKLAVSTDWNLKLSLSYWFMIMTGLSYFYQKVSLCDIIGLQINMT